MFRHASQMTSVPVLYFYKYFIAKVFPIGGASINLFTKFVFLIRFGSYSIYITVRQMELHLSPIVLLVGSRVCKIYNGNLGPRTWHKMCTKIVDLKETAENNLKILRQTWNTTRLKY